jgi:EpsI family protein
MARRRLISGLVIGLLGLATVLAWLPGGTSAKTADASLGPMPDGLPGWHTSDHVPSDVLPADFGAPVHVVRTYERGGERLWVSVAYYPVQTEGERPPALDLLYPSHGWSELVARPLLIPLDGRRRSIPANLLLMRSGERRVAVLYWYQLQGTTVASDHWYRALLLYSRLVRGRSDGALVRIASPLSAPPDVATTLEQLTRFVDAFYPELIHWLPR